MLMTDQEKWKLKIGYWFTNIESIRDLDKIVFKESCEPNPARKRVTKTKRDFFPTFSIFPKSFSIENLRNESVTGRVSEFKYTHPHTLYIYLYKYIFIIY